MYKLITIIMVIAVSHLFAQSDTIPPILTLFSFTPDSVDVTSGFDTVTFTIGAMDNLSGVTGSCFYLESPSTTQNVHGHITFEQGSLADTTTGTVIVEQYAETGDWTVAILTLWDVIGNESYYSTADLQTMGFPVTLYVGDSLSITDENLTIGNLMLYQNYPNPFDFSTMIAYKLPHPMMIEISFYNILGKKIETLYKGKKQSGNHKIKVEAGNLPSGIYFYELRSKNYSVIKKCVIFR